MVTNKLATMKIDNYTGPCGGLVKCLRERTLREPVDLLNGAKN